MEQTPTTLLWTNGHSKTYSLIWEDRDTVLVYIWPLVRILNVSREETCFVTKSRMHTDHQDHCQCKHNRNMRRYSMLTDVCFISACCVHEQRPYTMIYCSLVCHMSLRSSVLGTVSQCVLNYHKQDISYVVTEIDMAMHKRQIKKTQKLFTHSLYLYIPWYTSYLTTGVK